MADVIDINKQHECQECGALAYGVTFCGYCRKWVCRACGARSHEDGIKDHGEGV